MFKLGLDFHGVIDDLSDEFKILAESLIKNGQEVHIITGGSWKEVKPLIDKIGIKYTHYFSIRDYHDNLGTSTNGFHKKYGFPLIDNDIWNRTKGDYCRENNISLHIDDTIQYDEYYTTPFARLWTKNKNKKVDRESKTL